jgi:hypothetical protein
VVFTRKLLAGFARKLTVRDSKVPMLALVNSQETYGEGFGMRSLNYENGATCEGGG